MAHLNYIIQFVLFFSLALVEITTSSSTPAPPNSIPLKINNQAGVKLDIYWNNHFASKDKDVIKGEIKMNLVKQPSSPILPGGTALINSFPGHKFILRITDQTAESSIIDDLIITKTPNTEEIFTITLDSKNNKLIANRSLLSTIQTDTTTTATPTTTNNMKDIKKSAEPITKPKLKSDSEASLKKGTKTDTTHVDMKSSSSATASTDAAVKTVATDTIKAHIVKEKDEMKNRHKESSSTTSTSQKQSSSSSSSSSSLPIISKKIETAKVSNNTSSTPSSSSSSSSVLAKIKENIKTVISTIVPPKPVTKPVDSIQKYFWQDALINFNDMKKLNIENENLLFSLFGETESFLNQSILSIAHTYHINSCFFHIIDMTAGSGMSDTGDSRGNSTAAPGVSVLSPRAAYKSWENEVSSPLSPLFNQESHLLVITHMEEYLSSIITSSSSSSASSTTTSNNNNSNGITPNTTTTTTATTPTAASNNDKMHELDFLLQLMDPSSSPVSNVIVVLSFLVPSTDFQKYHHHHHHMDKNSNIIGTIIGDFIHRNINNNNNKEENNSDKSQFDWKKYLSHLLTKASSMTSSTGASGTSGGSGTRVEFNFNALIGRITRSEVQRVQSQDTNNAVTATSVASGTHATVSRETSTPLIASSELWYCQSTLLYTSQICRILLSIIIVIACFIIVWMDQTYKRKHPGPVDSMTIVLENADILKLRNYQQKLQFNYNQTAAGISNNNNSNSNNDSSSSSLNNKLNGNSYNSNNDDHDDNVNAVKLVRSVTIQDNDFTYDSILSSEIDSSSSSSNSNNRYNTNTTNSNSDNILNNAIITANNTMTNSNSSHHGDTSVTLTPKIKSASKRRKSISKSNNSSNSAAANASASTTPVVDEYDYNSSSSSSSSSFMTIPGATTGRNRTPSRKIVNAATVDDADDGSNVKTAKATNRSSSIKKRSASKGRKSI